MSRQYRDLLEGEYMNVKSELQIGVLDLVKARVKLVAIIILILAYLGSAAYFVLAKGLVIDRHTVVNTTNHQHQEQFQGQFIIEVDSGKYYASKDSKFVWKHLKVDIVDGHIDAALMQLESEMNALHPASYVFKDIVITERSVYLIFCDPFVVAETK